MGYAVSHSCLLAWTEADPSSEQHWGRYRSRSIVRTTALGWLKACLGVRSSTHKIDFIRQTRVELEVFTDCGFDGMVSSQLPLLLLNSVTHLFHNLD